MVDHCDICGQPVDLASDEVTFRMGFLCGNDPVAGVETSGTFGLIITCRPACALSPRILHRVDFDPAAWNRMVSEHRRRMQASFDR